MKVIINTTLPCGWKLTHQGAEDASLIHRNGEAESFDTTGLKVKSFDLGQVSSEITWHALQFIQENIWATP